MEDLGVENPFPKGYFAGVIAGVFKSLDRATELVKIILVHLKAAENPSVYFQSSHLG
jgi:phage shock protein PspC (stress-responsive transcriptional regulator)